MYLGVKEDGAEAIVRLLKRSANNTVLHFYCPECEEEQVTYSEETRTFIEELNSYGKIYLGYPCTNCESIMVEVSQDDIFGVEDVFGVEFK